MNNGSPIDTKDQYAAKLSVNIMGGESYVLVNNVREYYRQLEDALADIKTDKKCSYLYFSFVALASATLEFSLNYILATYCFEKFGYHDYKRYLKIYEKINFKDKLFVLPQIIYEGKYVMNEDCSTIKNLYELVSLRNNLLHNSENVQTFESPEIGTIIVDGGLLVPWKKTDNGVVHFNFEVKDSIITTLSKEQCIGIGESLLNFRDLLMTPFLNHEPSTNCELLITK